MNLRVLLGYAAPYRASLALGVLLMLVEAGIALSIPWIGGRFAAAILSTAATSSAAILLALLGLFACQALLKFGNSFVMGRTSAQVLADLRVRIYDHLQSLPLGFHQARRQGDVLALITYEVRHLSGFITGTLLSIPSLLIMVVGALILMLRIDALLAALVALLVPVFYFTLKVLGRRLRPLAQQLQEADAMAVAIAGENLGMLPAIKTFTREVIESNRYARQVDQVRSLGVQELRIYAALEPAVQLISATAVVVLLWLASSRISRGEMSAAELVSFLLYAVLLTRPVSALAAVYGQAQMARGTLARLQNVLTEKPEPIRQAAHDLPQVAGEVSFRDIRFSYPGRPALLTGLNLHVRAGETVAITGENGAGKSTLANLLMRLHEPDAGRILIDGIDIATVNLHSLRRQIGVVPQHVLLFNGTVRDNIGYGLAGATALQIEQAARVAQAHEFICRLPQGYDTLIGDQGIRLSGGQRQRLALARALLKAPPILVLDEATAMFDPGAEASFIEECHQSLVQRTVILITHRPASLALADRVMNLRDGTLHETTRSSPASEIAERRRARG